MSTAGIDVLEVGLRCCPLGPIHPEDEASGSHDVSCRHRTEEHIGARLPRYNLELVGGLDVVQDDARPLVRK